MHFKTTSYTDASSGQTSYYQNCYFYGVCVASTGVTINNRTFVTTCCQSNKCNDIKIQPKVSYCYVGEIRATRVLNQTFVNNSVAIMPCTSPKNQYCMVNLAKFYIRVS